MKIKILSIDAEEVDFRPGEKGRRWTLDAPLTAVLSIDGEDLEIVVPEGFTTNFASVPRPLWFWLPPTGRYWQAAVIHDWLCAAKPLASKVAHKIFHALMRYKGVSRARAKLMYWAVKVGGPRFEAVE